MNGKVTTCSTCKRCVYTTDVDKNGDCIVCAPAPVPAPGDGGAK